MSWSKSVYSSHVVSVGWNDETEELEVEFANGRVAGYKGVPEDVAMRLAHAPSVGAMLRDEIKNQFPFRYVR
jgi:hypothetical protein